jgi:tetratricopeptide (TPR) repeat protein
MKRAHLLSCLTALFLAGVLAWACGYDTSLREYLSARFWFPFTRDGSSFEKSGVTRTSAPYAGMATAEGDTPLARLRAAYQKIAQPVSESFDLAPFREAVSAARADQSLSKRDREEVDLIDAKIDMRANMPGEWELLLSSKAKLDQFLKTAENPEFLSEARGWLGHVDLLLGDQTAAGKIYLDELNRQGSNVSREAVLNSIYQTYRYDGGPELLQHLDEYFDTAEHAAFAIQLVTNPPQPTGDPLPAGNQPRVDRIAQTYDHIRSLLSRHQDLLRSNTGSNQLGLLSMRTALRAGDPPGAIKIAEMIPPDADIRSEPDFDWMLGSAYFLAHRFAAAEKPLLSLFQSQRSTGGQKATAAYGLCGVYRKTKNVVEEIRFALWLRAAPQRLDANPPDVWSISWSGDTLDAALLLDAEAPISALQEFVSKYPGTPDTNLVQYALAVRLARLNEYDKAAHIYESIKVPVRAQRMRRLADLYREANRTDLPAEQSQAAKYSLAEFISSHEVKLYFNDTLWGGWQGRALTGAGEVGFTQVERQTQTALERRLRDDQEEYWRAYLILRGIVQDAGKSDLGRKATKLAIRCVRKINPRFGRHNDIVKADLELSRWLREL